MTDANPLKIISAGVDNWTEALIDGYPIPWTNQADREPGGVMYSAFHSVAANLQFINDWLVYAFDGSRIATATGLELDLVGKDFYGDDLPRKVGESDASYRQRIQSSLFIPYSTKEAFMQAITALTGVAPRLIEPWIASDTSAWDWSYWDVDIPERPALYGQSSLNYQAFVIATLPSPSGQGQGTAVWGYDAGAGYDVYTGTYWNLQAQNFISQAELDALINRIKAFGITIWRQYEYPNNASFPLPASYFVATGLNEFNISLPNFQGPYVVIASCNWTTRLIPNNLTSAGFRISSTAPSPSGARLNYVVIPIATQGAGLLPLVPDEMEAILPAPIAPAGNSNRAAISPNFNTQIKINDIAPGALTVEMDNIPGTGNVLYYYFFPQSQSALQYTATGDIGIAILISGLKPCAPFILPSWETDVAVTADNAGIYGVFTNAAPPGGFVQWGYVLLSGS